jgi:hypothetical protein
MYNFIFYVHALANYFQEFTKILPEPIFSVIEGIMSLVNIIAFYYAFLKYFV